MVDKATTKARESLFARIKSVLVRPSVPVNDAQANQVADAVAREVAPVLVNASNSEPWYRSRIYLGLMVSVLGLITSRFGFVLSANDLDTIVTTGQVVVQSIGTLLEGGGLLYATYGRIVGSRKPPLGGGK